MDYNFYNVTPRLYKFQRQRGIGKFPTQWGWERERRADLLGPCGLRR